MGLKSWAIIFAFGFIPALAFSPEEAQGVGPAGEGALVESVRLAEAIRGFGELGLAGELAASYREGLSAELTLRLNLDPAVKTRAELEALTARARLGAVRRKAIRQALLAHAELWQAEANLEAAQAQVRLRQLELKAARARRAGPLELEARSLALEEAGLALEAAESSHRSAEARVRMLGFSPPAEPRVLRFALPPATPDRTEALRLKLQALEAQAAYRRLAWLQAGLFYQGALSYRLSAETAGPSLALTLGPEDPLRPAGTLEFSLSARIQLDPAAWMQARKRTLDLRAEEADRRLQEQTTALRTGELRENAERAWRRLQLAEKKAALARKQAALAQKRLRRGLLSPLEAERVRLSYLDAKTARADAWRRYLEAVAAYLEAVNGSWEVAR